MAKIQDNKNAIVLENSYVKFEISKILPLPVKTLKQV